MQRYAIEKLPQDEGERVLYWVVGADGWNAQMPDASYLMTGPQADRELARLKVSISHVADRLAIVDVVVRLERNAIFGAAFRASIAGKARSPEAMEAAKAAGNAALQLAGYTV